MNTPHPLHSALPPTRHRLTIPVTAGVGTGPTELAAFDCALGAAGIGDMNLIRLSSVIPPATIVVPDADGCDLSAATWGDRLYVVYAEQRAATPGEVAAAVVGWVQDPDTGAGLFVELEGDDEARICADAVATLDAMVARRGIKFPAPQVRSVSVRCIDEPVCAIVAATYMSQDW